MGQSGCGATTSKKQILPLRVRMTSSTSSVHLIYAQRARMNGPIWLWCDYEQEADPSPSGQDDKFYKKLCISFMRKERA
jgi:hypothetical protein